MKIRALTMLLLFMSDGQLVQKVAECETCVIRKTYLCRQSNNM